MSIAVIKLFSILHELHFCVFMREQKMAHKTDLINGCKKYFQESILKYSKIKKFNFLAEENILRYWGLMSEK